MGEAEQRDGQSSASRRRRATRADVARLAGVSTAVVSYVFNNGPRPVAPETARRVRSAAEKLDYRPNSVARALSTGSSRTLGVIVPDLSNPFFSDVYGELESIASHSGYSALFMASHQNPSKEQNRIARLIAREVDAIIVASARPASELSSIPRKECPFVFLDQTRPVPGAKCVSTDFQSAVESAVRHLLGHGHTAIAMLSGKAGDGLADPRIQGWQRVHEQAGITAGPVIDAGFTRQGGYEAMLALLDSGRCPGAVFADSDLEAIGALRALHERHIRVPEDVALVSFDGTVDSAFSWPPLTVVRQDAHAIAERIFHASVEPDRVPDLQLVAASLVARRSCGCDDDSRTTSSPGSSV
ncbi:LacI family DNA-binding transcriptional regulator [Bifidobacterium aesculapii]|uniref:LacI family DNA-binding transcriptional regulator n=1 Tax=Bifidobacterium aesculapii TaxID=1329411 RepID=UPI0006E3BB1D|nr:LacI family DNA-binding transcriptional regulator [Bifidobacterium aesculapii]